MVEMTEGVVKYGKCLRNPRRDGAWVLKSKLKGTLGKVSNMQRSGNLGNLQAWSMGSKGKIVGGELCTYSVAQKMKDLV